MADTSSDIKLIHDLLAFVCLSPENWTEPAELSPYLSHMSFANSLQKGDTPNRTDPVACISDGPILAENAGLPVRGKLKASPKS